MLLLHSQKNVHEKWCDFNFFFTVVFYSCLQKSGFIPQLLSNKKLIHRPIRFRFSISIKSICLLHDTEGIKEVHNSIAFKIKFLCAHMSLIYYLICRVLNIKYFTIR